MEQSELNNLKTLEDLENQELFHLRVIKDLEEREIEKIDSLHPMRFKDISSWKSMVWDDCSEKRMNDSKKVVSFYCNLTNKVCSFQTCPKNIVADKKEEN
jgi:hypothetical protein